MAPPPQEESKVEEDPSASTTVKNKDKKGKDKAEGGSSDAAGLKLPKGVVNELLKNNPTLANEFKGMPDAKMEELISRLKLEDLLTGVAPGGKNKTDMASHKFWSTQPVPKFGELSEESVEDGPIRKNDLSKVPAEPSPLLEGFEWVTMDINDPDQMNEIYTLLSGHYVEDHEEMFRFKYSASFLNWALKSPGWLQEWHVGVRVTTSRKLVAFISGIPVDLRIRKNSVPCSEINFLCVHKKLRSKRLTPVLIKEITRRCNRKEIWNAIYTVGVVLPTPISTCRYFHRSLDWLKLNEVGFSPLPPNSTKARQVTKYQLPSNAKTPGLREMTREDLPATHSLLVRYLDRFDVAPNFTLEEMEHWMLHTDKPGAGPRDRVIWTYVVPDPSDPSKITDFFSFYGLDSSVINNKKHDEIRAAYQFYYATEAAWSPKKNALKTRLNELVHDILVLAKKLGFDVFNALTLMDNTLFLEQQRFGAGDGNLNYYLFNWRTKVIRGGINEKNQIDEENGSGIGVVML